MDDEEVVVLTDKDGHDLLNPDGTLRTMEKIEAHRRGVGHRAVSVFIFNHAGDLLLQKRAPDKYHSAGKWTNTCCTHCRPGEIPLATATRRLREEMGLSCALHEVFTFPYHADVGNGLIENEFDHVFVGQSDDEPDAAPSEISEWRWVSTASLQEDLARDPDKYTYWLQYSLCAVIEHGSQSRPQRDTPGEPQAMAPPEILGRICFIICPLGEEHIKNANRFRDEIVRPVVVDAGFSPAIKRADVTQTNADITRVIDENLATADLVVADLTGPRANVIYELGKRHALGGMTVQFTRDPLNNLPFNVRQNYTIQYNLDTAEAIDNAKEEFRVALTCQLAQLPQGLSLAPIEASKRLNITLVVDIVVQKGDQYIIASGMGGKRCKRMFLFQRSSTLLLGPHRDWDDERTFYRLLFQHIADGAEFYHIVDLEGIRRHYTSYGYPDCLQALSRLVCHPGLVSVVGPSGRWAFKRVSPPTEDEDLKPDRQARTFIVELDSGIAEGVLVTDLGGMTATFHLAGRGMLHFMNECITYYNKCPPLTPSDIDSVFGGDRPATWAT